MRRDRAAVLVRGLAACALIASAACVVACAPGRATHASAPTPASAMQASTQVDFRDAEAVVLAYVSALRSADASEAASRMTSYRRAETRAHGWKQANAWWKAVRIRTVTRPGHYLTDEHTYVDLYAERYGHPPYKLVVMNVAYSATLTAPAGDIDFVVTKDTVGAPWLVHDYGGAVFRH